MNKIQKARQRGRIQERDNEIETVESKLDQGSPYGRTQLQSLEKPL